jgi:hypothetical protein
MYMTVAESPEFSRRTQHLLTEDEIDELIEYLAIHPQAGDIMQGTGGVRKLRWAREGKGKHYERSIRKHQKGTRRSHCLCRGQEE